MSRKFSDFAKAVILAVVFALAIFIIYYCVKSIFDHKSGNDVLVNNGGKANVQMKSISGGVWGSRPQEACNAFQQQGLLTYPYKKDDKDDKWICASPDVRIPDTKGPKTIRYEGLGYADKVTEYHLVLKLDIGQYKKEDEAAKKVWAIYITVLMQHLFNITLSEADMKSLATLQVGNTYKGNYDTKLGFIVKAEKIGNQEVYNFTAYGMPMFKVE